MASRKNQLRIVARSHAQSAQSGTAAPPPTVSPRWLLTAVILSVVAAALCAWAALCLLFWQGSWQLLYHPKAAIARTPANAGIAFEPVGFAANETGQMRLQGWWIPAEGASPLSRYTVLYLHGATGNLGDTVDALAQLHALGVNLFAFDYRGYGQSEFAHPSESRWREDADSALRYLTESRHIDPRTILLDGEQLGADLAIEVAAAHPNLAAVIVNAPQENAGSVIFGDSRARMVPAHLLASERYDIDAAAAQLRIPSLWIVPYTANSNAGEPSAFARTTAPKQLVRVNAGSGGAKQAGDAISNWLMKLPNR